MNSKLPKPILDALAHQATPADHPSADVLSVFVERALGEDEKRSVTDHLARCPECREIVFLASEASEPAATDQQIVAAKPRWRWTSRWVWAAPVAAIFLLGAGYLVRRSYVAAPAGSEIASQRAPERVGRPPGQLQEVTPAPREPAEVASPPMAKARPRTMPATLPPIQKAEPAAADVLVMNAAPPTPPKNGAVKAKAATAEPAGIAIGGPAAGTAPAVPRGNSFASTTSEGVQQYPATDSLSLSVNRDLAAVRTAHPGWRVTPQGHLEHFTPDGWSRVLADQASVFRVVSVIGGEVWAGGNDGVLFHSGDSGVTWHKVSIGNARGGERAAIVSIRFDDSQHGVVIIDTGTSYSTTDGGVTWAKQ